MGLSDPAGVSGEGVCLAMLALCWCLDIGMELDLGWNFDYAKGGNSSVPHFPHLQKETIKVAGFRELASVHRSDLCLAVPGHPYLGAVMLFSGYYCSC